MSPRFINHIHSQFKNKWQFLVNTLIEYVVNYDVYIVFNLERRKTKIVTYYNESREEK